MKIRFEYHEISGTSWIHINSSYQGSKRGINLLLPQEALGKKVALLIMVFHLQRRSAYCRLVDYPQSKLNVLNPQLARQNECVQRRTYRLRGSQNTELEFPPVIAIHEGEIRISDKSVSRVVGERPVKRGSPSDAMIAAIGFALSDTFIWIERIFFNKIQHYGASTRTNAPYGVQHFQYSCSTQVSR